MTVTEKPTLRFSLKIFPWLIVLATLAVYLATANRWVTYNSLPVIGKLLGWDWWSTQGTPPLLYLITLPFTWLPPGQAPALLNALTAVLAALTLGTLARTVALLPQDRTREQRQRERSAGGLLSIPTNWIPPLFAVFALGFQLTFWENATAATGEMLNVLLFAHLIRCLLEYRVEQKESWLCQFVLVYGLATANNWAMIGFFPIFLAALIWFRGKAFFKLKFLGKLAAFGLLGLLLYLLMPAVESARGNGAFGTLLREDLGLQKQILFNIPPWLPLMLSFVVFLPLLSLGVRWPSNMGEANPIAAVLTLVMFYLVHALFLGFSIWVMLDPGFSPRALGMGLPFLTFYYLSALNIGYYSGYFLLLFRKSEQRGWKRQSGLKNAAAWAITVAVWLGPVVIAGWLIQHNLPAIKGNNLSALQDYTQRMAAGLPEKGAMLLSEEPHLLLLLEAHYAADGKNPHMLLDTRSLPYARYQATLAKRYPGRWTDLVSGKSLPEPLPGAAVVQLIGLHAQTNQLFYLHPASGPQILEHYHQVPRGVVFAMQLYQTNQTVAPPVSEGTQELNRRFWQEQRDFLNQLQPYIKQTRSSAAIVGRYLSRSLNQWAVALHQAGRTNETGKIFADALMLNPANLAAKINQAGQVDAEDWGHGRTWSVMLRENGSFCIPQLQFDLGRTLTGFGLYRQAVEQFEHALQARPEQLDYRLAYADALLRGQVPQQALQLLDPVRNSPDFAQLAGAAQLEIIRLEANARLAMTDYRGAETSLLAARKKFPKEEIPLNGLLAVYLAEKRFTDALAVTQEQLTVNSNNPLTFTHQGLIHLELRQYPQAVSALEQALKLAPDNSVNHFYLGEAALRQNDKAQAIRHYEKFLSVAAPKSADAAMARQRLKELKGG